MKVSLSPKFVESVSEKKTEYQENPKASETGKNSSVSVIDEFFLPESEVSKNGAPETDPFDEVCAFFSDPTPIGPNGDPISEADFANITVPKISDILKDMEATGMEKNLDLFDTLEQKYYGLLSKVQDSINFWYDRIDKDKIRELPANDSWKALITNNPEVKNVVLNLIQRREEKLELIKVELDCIEPLKQEIKDIFKQEENSPGLQNYLKERKEWSDAYDNPLQYQTDYPNGKYVSDPATLANKPSPMDYEIDLNKDGYIGDPSTTFLAIAHKKTTDKDGMSHEIYDIISTKTGKPVGINSDGTISETTSGKDLGYQTTLIQKNVNIVEKDNWPDDVGAETDLYVELTGTEGVITGYGKTGAPIRVEVPEFIRVDEKTGRAVGFGELKNGEIGQVAQEKGDGWKLVRVTSAVVELEPSTNTEEGGKYDYVVKYIGTDNHKPLFTLRIRGHGNNFAASDRTISVAAAENRATGMHIDAAGLKGVSGFTLSDTVISKIKEEYKFSPTDPQFTNAKDKLNEGPFGIIVEGFKTVSLEGSSYNDLVLLEDADKDYDYLTDANGEHSPALATSAIYGGNGYNAIFHKSGNLYADGCSMVVGGSGDDDIYLALPQKGSIKDEAWINYVELNNTKGTAHVANQMFHLENEDWGTKGDDYYGVNAKNKAFSGIYEPDVWDKYGEELWGGERPDGKKAVDADNLFTGFNNIASLTEIKIMVDDQIKAHIKALNDLAVENDDEDELFKYSESEWGGYYASMKNETDTFFAGWNSFFNPDLSADIGSDDDEGIL